MINTPTKKERKSEDIINKVFCFIIICALFFLLNLLNYDFENQMYNGFLVLVLNILFYKLLEINKYYIEFGVRDYDVEKLDKKDEFALFNRMHPFIAIYNKLLSIISFILLVIGFIMIVSSFL